MIFIGESLNVISKKIGQAFKERDPGPIREEALAQKASGMDYIDINLGPAKKDGRELMPWVIQTVQEAVDLPLSLDTSNIEAIEAGLKVYNQTAGRPLINSIMVRPERYEKMLPLAAEYNADFIALMWGPQGLPRDENERAVLAVELMTAASEAGLANERMWFDGIVTPVNSQQDQLVSLLNFQMMIGEISPGCKSVCGLSNASNGTPAHLRPIINQTYMIMLERYGMHAVIADPRDEKLADIARGNRPDIRDVVQAVMDGEKPEAATRELQDYVKTARVILGHTLYSDSWLEV